MTIFGTARERKDFEGMLAKIWAAAQKKLSEYSCDLLRNKSFVKSWVELYACCGYCEYKFEYFNCNIIVMF